MAELAQDALYRLAAWMSPAFPLGAFAYSHGLEQAVEAGAVRDAAGLTAFLADALEHGAGRSDAILLAEAWRGTLPLDELAALARARAAARERLVETEALGAAFAEAAAAWGVQVAPAPYPVALGAAARQGGLPLRPVLLLFLQAFASNLATAAQRLMPLDQRAAQGVIAALGPICARVAEEAADAPLDAIGGAAFRLDIAAMRHESQAVRLFLT